MAELQDRLPQNIPGRFFVDDSCIDCDLCRSNVPHFFRRDDDIGLSFVFRQPETLEEIQHCLDALADCPTNSIGEV